MTVSQTERNTKSATAIRPFRVEVPQAELDDLLRRIESAR
jgi:hypothetical protein